jgi:malate dehydrogenase (oxaloacetate-decarboxylating)(NADP+)
MHSGVARRQIDLNTYRDELIRRQGFGQQFRYTLFNMVKAGKKQRIVFAEGEEPKIIRAAHRVEEEGIGTPILLGNPDKIRDEIAQLGFQWSPHIVTPGPETDPHYGRYFETLYEMRQRKGANQYIVRSMLRSVNFYAPMMVRMGDADAYVSGLTREYPDVARPMLQVLGRRPGVKVASGVYIIIVKNRVYFFTDTTINIDPTSEQLAQIAISAADFAVSLGHEPRVAMLSFSNFGSVPHPLADKMREAVDIVVKVRPDIPIDGEMQADSAVVEEIITSRYPFSRVKNANVLVFPGLASANIAYKLIARITEAEAIGPVLLGAGAPVQVLQAGDDVDSIVALTAFAALDAQRRHSAGR